MAPSHGWAVLLAIMLLAAYVRHFFNLRHRGRTVWAIPVTARSPRSRSRSRSRRTSRRPRRADRRRFARVQAIVTQRCVSCHADQPTQEGFAIAPKNVMLHTPELIVANAQKIYEQAS